MVGKRSDKLEIIEDLLGIASTPYGATKTKLVYQSNLNFTRLENFLPFLIEKNLIEPFNDDDSKYVITTKGRQFLKQLKMMQNML